MRANPSSASRTRTISASDRSLKLSTSRHSAVANWGYADSKNMWIQDRSGGSTNKAYAGFTGRNIAAGDVWTGHVLYMADHFSATAATTLDF